MSRQRNKVGTFVFACVSALYCYAALLADQQLFYNRDISSGRRATVYALTGAALLMSLTTSANWVSDILTGLLMLVPAFTNYYLHQGSTEETTAMLLLSLFGVLLLVPEGLAIKPFSTAKSPEPILPQHHQPVFIDAKPQ